MNFPLDWPAGWPRTPTYKRQGGNFKMTRGRAITELADEIRQLGGKWMIISTNLPVRLDGLPYADARLVHNDPGVAVYFTLKERNVVFACDRYSHVDANIRAIGLTVAAIRGVERWGTTGMLERAFTGFAALPPVETGVVESTYEEPRA